MKIEEYSKEVKANVIDFKVWDFNERQSDSIIYECFHKNSWHNSLNMVKYNSNFINIMR